MTSQEAAVRLVFIMPASRIMLFLLFSGKSKKYIKIFMWVPASEDRRKTIEYDAEIEKGRIIFKGEVATDNIRQKYLHKNVKGLYKHGEANPVKVFMA